MKPTPEKTGLAFMTHFTEAEEYRLERNMYTQTKFANSATAAHTFSPCDTTDDATELTSASTVSDLISAMTKATLETNEKHTANIKALIGAMNSTTTQQTSKGGNRRTKRPRKKRPTSTVLSYCWSCGTTTNVDHTSLTCENQRPGHILTATSEDKQGGSTHDWANGRQRY
jgi:hypothetical protein